MSETNDTNASDNNDDSSTFTPHPSSGMLVNRRLKSFGPPDLEVVVGKSQRLYRYHSFILASYSSYVDTMLSSPMWKETQDKHICFPDVEPEIWEKLIRFLEPGGMKVSQLTHEELLDLVPICDKYQFEDGMRFCNDFLEQFYERIRESFCLYDRTEVYIPLAVMVYNLDLPCKPKAMEYAAKILSTWLLHLREDEIKQLLPLVENDDVVLRAAVTTVVGRKSEDMSIEEIRAATKEEDFPTRCVTRTKQVKELDVILQAMHVGDSGICVSVLNGGNLLGEALSGTYKECDRRSGRQTYQHIVRERPAAPGALRFIYKREVRSYGGRQADARIEAVDVFGNKWELFVLEEVNEEGSGEEEDESKVEKKHNRRVYFTWEGGYSSLFPPKSGWKRVDDMEENPRCDVDYTLSVRKAESFY